MKIPFSCGIGTFGLDPARFFQQFIQQVNMLESLS